MRTKRQTGFTLIELLIVVAIIAAILIPNFLEALEKARQRRTLSDVRDIGSAAIW